MATVDFDHPSWRIAGATAASYLLVLVGLTLLLFVLPYLLVHFVL